MTEVVNWSYILKYLLKSSSKLRKQLQREKRLHDETLTLLNNTQSRNGIGKAGSNGAASDIGGNTAAAVDHMNIHSSPLDIVRMRADANGVKSSTGPFDFHHNKLGSRLAHTNEALLNNKLTASEDDLFQQAQRNLNNSVSGTSYSAEEDILANYTVDDSEMSTTSSAKLSNNTSDNNKSSNMSPISNASVAFTPLDSSSCNQHFSDYPRTELQPPQKTPKFDAKAPSFRTETWTQPSPFQTKPIQKQQLQLQPQSQSQSKRSSKPSSTPSAFAKEVVENLGVEGQQAAVAMGIIDKVSRITDEQLQQLDEDTRNQILQIRRDLKIDTASINSANNSNNNSNGSSLRIRNGLRGPAVNPSSSFSPVSSGRSRASSSTAQRRPIPGANARANMDTNTDDELNRSNLQRQRPNSAPKPRPPSPAVSVSSSISQLTSPGHSVSGLNFNNGAIAGGNANRYRIPSTVNGQLSSKNSGNLLQKFALNSGQTTNNILSSVLNAQNNSNSGSNRYNHYPSANASASRSSSKYYEVDDDDTAYSQLDELER